MDRLYVKNCGPLKEIDIILKDINLFIGQNGSGKSVLAKIITIVLDTVNNRLDELSFKQKFEDFNIDYIDSKTIIKVTSKDELVFELKNKKFNLPFTKKVTELHKKAIELESDSLDRKAKLNDMINRLKNLNETENLNERESLEDRELIKVINETLEKEENNYVEIQKNKKAITMFSSQYIPAERNLISLFSQSLSSLVAAEIPLPKFLLQFSSEYEKARKEIKKLELLNIKYEFKDGKEYIIYGDTGDAILFEHSSSGIQSALPLYLTTKYFAKKHRDIIVEEPEQNLFPSAQYETILHLVSHVSDKNELFIMTHSPYVLSTLNNLLFAYKISILNKKAKSRISKILEEKYWINPDKFSAYYLEDGKARNIVGERGLISENEIDEISHNIAGEFDEMLEIYREYKNAK